MRTRLLALVGLTLLLGLRCFPGTPSLGEADALPRSLALAALPARPQNGPLGAPTEPALTWARTYGDTEDEEAQAIIQTADGGYAFAGATGLRPSYQAWLVKLSARGTVQWTRTYDGFTALKLLQTADQGYVLTGIHGGGISPTAGSNVWLVKTDAQGALQWTRTFDWRAGDEVWAVLQTQDGGFVLGGATHPAPSDEAFRWVGWLMKTDAGGTLQWVRLYDDLGLYRVHAVIQTTDGGFALAGDGQPAEKGFNYAWLVKTDELGNIIWTHRYGGPGYDIADAVLQTGDGGFALGGLQGGNGWVAKTDTGGTVEWTRTYSGPGGGIVKAMILTPDGGFVLAGYTRSYGAGWSDAWLLKTDAQGVPQWDRTYGGPEEDYAKAVIQTGDEGFALAGWTVSYGAGGRDAWVVKTDAWGIAPEPQRKLRNWVVLGGLGGLILIPIIVIVWRTQKRRL